MKSNFYKMKNMIQILIILICSAFTAFITFSVKNLNVTIISTIFSIIIILGFYMYEGLFKSYMIEIIIKLSDMLAIMTDMKEKEVFSIVEDSIFSKLQSQTIKLTRILKAQNKQIEDDKNEIKSLISDIAHQLKTPLTNLKMYGEFLQYDNLTEEERRDFQETIMVSLNELSFLVESMIKMSRLESGVIQLKPCYESLNETILLAIGQIRKKAQFKNIILELNEKEKVTILHDRNWTIESVFNILENAVKYTKENGVINISIQSYEIFARIDIEDNGIGISEEELPKIFSRFYRGKNVGDVEGIGIGLYLTREIISKQGGYIKVKSKKQGTVFSIFLPIK
ncbi:MULTISPECIES: HAMP domain-containing sensor histidine kinase [unclassified Clostridium]|uniref:sensor histidine kinase n=1 Tax=unclassified Clostridium TaxID=2614128 RepID=UPI0032178579